MRIGRGAAWAAALVWAAAATGAARASDWPEWGGRHGRNMASDARGLPERFDVGATALEEKAGKADPPPTPAQAGMDNVRWAARLGTQTYGNPTISGGRVFVGTNNGAPRDPKYDGDRGVLMCFREADGAFLWQLVVPKIPAGGTFNGDYAGLGICSSPTVEGDRVFVVTNRGEVLCLDARGLADGNDGPFQDEAQLLAKPQAHKVTEGPDGPVIAFTPGPPVRLGPTDADVIWRFDMMAETKAWPQDASSCSVLIWGDYVYVGTPNGVDKSHTHIPSPKAPSLIVLDKRTGALLAVDDADVGPRVYHGQWSSPSMGVVGGRRLVFYGAGDGVCYAFDAEPQPGSGGKPGVLRKVWWFDCNPPEYKTREDGKPVPYKFREKGAALGGGPSEIIGTAVFHDGRVYVAVGQDPRHGKGAGCLSSIDASKTGDITASGEVWRYKGIHRSLSTVSVADGLVYAADFSGVLHCVDAGTGRPVWTHDTGSPIWSSTLAADGKVYLGTERRRLWVLAAGREKRVLAEINMGSPVYTTPVVAGGVLYVTSQKWLYAVAGQPPGAAR